jgi:hypothetical protein
MLQTLPVPSSLVSLRVPQGDGDRFQSIRSDNAEWVDFKSRWARFRTPCLVAAAVICVVSTPSVSTLSFRLACLL